ncbi:MAG: endopeptidase La, partial [Clostridiales bacterium]|nr:endopeptidase La [Clostridiales bacterium]
MENLHTLPLLPLRNLVVFPHTQVSFDAVRPKSIRALEEVMQDNKLIFLVTQSDGAKENPSALDLYKIGIIARVTQTVRAHNGITRVMAEGVCRARLEEILEENPYYRCVAQEIPEEEEEHMIVNEGFIRGLEKVFDEYFALNRNIPPQNFITATGDVKPGRFADAIAANINLNYTVKQEILEELDPYDRIEKLMSVLSKEIQVLKVSREIEAKVKKNIEENQREYYLREEMKVIEEELGEKEGIRGEAEAYRESLKKLHLKKDITEKLMKDISRFERMNPSSPDSSVMRNYLDLVLDLPWNRASKETVDIQKAQEVLDADHYGLEKVKERVLEYLAVHKLTKGKDGTVICLVGPPGTGKTSVAKSIARALGRKYVRISLGGIHDEADIRGHRKTYIGAMPGRVISAVAEAKVKNPLILFDEIDKMGADYKGDPSAALLEVLDSEQNYAFRDHFVEVPFDLSGAMFITTANTVATIPEPLLDRIEVIEVSGYTNEEKKCIAKQYLIPRQAEKNGLAHLKLTIDDGALGDLISFYTRESGVRSLEREIGNLMRKAAKKVLEENRRSLKITAKNLTGYLGRHRFSEDSVKDKNEVGIVRGLAWTSVGGDTLSIEVNVMPGTGKLELTGNLGDVMKESAMAAVSYIRTRCGDYGIYEKFYKTCDIHIHVP